MMLEEGRSWVVGRNAAGPIFDDNEGISFTDLMYCGGDLHSLTEMEHGGRYIEAPGSCDEERGHWPFQGYRWRTDTVEDLNKKRATAARLRRKRNTNR